jgi:hypothetical protein
VVKVSEITATNPGRQETDNKKKRFGIIDNF